MVDGLYMSNSNLKNFDNFYADLAQSAYANRPNNFPPLNNSKTFQDFNFSEDIVFDGEITPGGKNLPHNGRVYLQPDPELRDTYKVASIPVPDANGMRQDIHHKRYQKGLLTDDEAGFSSYYLTDTPTLTKDTKKTYMTIRGSDAISLENLNDWIDNDAKFALNHIHTPQAKLATVGMKTKIAEMREKAPQATMDITDHSLGTIVSAQGVAGLTDEELKKIGKVVLFDGPDTTKSLKKMGLSDEKIQKISEKIEYYVNPFDIMGMLNREHTITKLPG